MFEMREAKTGLLLTGILSRVNAKEVLARLLSTVKEKQALTLDLSGLTACDSAGLSVILSVRRFMGSKGSQLLLANPPLFFRDLVRVSGLDIILHWA